jgi:YegS/Rv2252/BmrU family lipid kinase
LKHIFIINPVAGKGKTYKLIPEIKEYFDNNSAASSDGFIIEMTKYPGHATELASAYSRTGNHRIYSVGGDGTLNEVLNGMAGSECSLASIPAGTGNDFIKTFSTVKSLKNIIARMVEGTEKLIDIASANGKLYANISSIGFDAQVVYNTMKYKTLPLITGEMAYTLGTLSAIKNSASKALHIDIDGECMQKQALLLAVGNGRFYGGGKMALPEADPADGLLDICLVDKVSRIKILALFPKYIKGEHGSLEMVHFYKCRKVVVHSEEPIVMNIDGEISVVNKAEFEIIPKGLRFVIPKSGAH